ncbi:MAG: hypothetical protein RIB60_11310 [Phycisphaerales bacterium]
MRRLTLAAITALTCVTSSVGAQPLTIPFSTIDGGGGSIESTSYSLRGSIGQHDVGGVVASASYALVGGFWGYEAPGVIQCSADCDLNGALNLDDIDCFVSAFLGGDLVSADCDGNSALNLDDIDCFVTSFLAGCP